MLHQQGEAQGGEERGEDGGGGHKVEGEGDVGGARVCTPFVGRPPHGPMGFPPMGLAAAPWALRLPLAHEARPSSWACWPKAQAQTPEEQMKNLIFPLLNSNSNGFLPKQERGITFYPP